MRTFTEPTYLKLMPKPGQNAAAGGLTRRLIQCLYTAFAALALAVAPPATAQPPTIQAFAASPKNIQPGGSATLAWEVSGATGVSLSPGVGAISGTNATVSPASSTTYTLTATNSDGQAEAQTTVNVSPYHYAMIYDSSLLPAWQQSSWESVPLGTDFDADAPGRTDRAIAVAFGPGNAWNAFGLAGPEQRLNEFRTFEFDIYFEPDSTGQEEMAFILNDAGFADEVRVVDFIPGWGAMPLAERLGRWLHATVDFQAIHPQGISANRFLWFNRGADMPHFRLADIKLGWLPDTTAPTVTHVSPTFDAVNGRLNLDFTTDEPAIYRIEYGVSAYSHAVQGDYYDWTTTHSAVLDQLVSGATHQYRILLLDHHTDPLAEANVGTFTGTFVVPVATNLPPPDVTEGGPTNHQWIYRTALAPEWTRQNWETAPLYTDFAASAPGRSGPAIEVHFGANNAWNAFGLGAGEQYFNEVRTLEFEIYFEADSTGNEDLSLIVGDTGFTDNPRITDLISGWFTMSRSQRYGHWHQVVASLPRLHPRVPSFNRFLLFNGGANQPHFRLANIRLGWTADTTPPTVTLVSAVLGARYDELTLTFNTSETTLYRVEFGTTNFAHTVQSGSSAWAMNHAVTLTGLTPGSTVQYRIVALDHRMDPAATPNEGILLGTYVIPPVPVTPPVISGLAATGVTGTRATLVWSNDRPCTAQLVYHKSGGPDLVRIAAALVANHSTTIDLLEPLTAYHVTVTATDAFSLSAAQSLDFTTGAASTPTVTISIQPTNTRPISPYIYGLNFYHQISNAPRNLTLNRAGGNRWTAYNWENNASNAGSDWFYSSDDYLGGGTEPAKAMSDIIANDRANNTASLITMQLQGYVAADKNGSVDISDPSHLATRFHPIVYRKSAPFTTNPDLNDGVVYIDEFMWTLAQKSATDIYADPAAPTFVSLDNEPELWPYTHAEIQSGAPQADDYIVKTISLASALKDVSPTVQLFGPVHYGFLGMYNWQMAGGFNSGYWFTDKYLTELKAASDAAGRRLLDVYDFHWYSEATSGGVRIGSLTSSNLTSAQVQAIVQSPRSLWDETYRENSWIADALGEPIYILGRVQAKVDAIWPGTRIAITEYGNGGDNHIAGAIAEADNLGIFASRGVYAAAFWPTSGSYPFILAGLKMFRDYDGNQGSFGDLSLAATSSDTSLVSTYISQDSQRTNRYVIVAINRSAAAQDVGFSGLPAEGTARVYRVQGTQTTPVFVGEIPARLNDWIVTLPALSVSTIELIAGSANDTFTGWQAAHFTAAELTNPAVSGPAADPDGVGFPNLVRYAFNLPARGAASRPGLVRRVPTGGGERLAVDFHRLRQATDVTYLIAASSDLVSWTPIATVAPGEPETVTVTDPQTATPDSHRFLRIQVQLNP
jgi:hypothetical protein